MSDDATTTDATAAEAEGGDVPAGKPHEESVPFDRFQQVNRKAKEAADQAKRMERELAELRRQIEDREAAGLPELEQMKRRVEQAEKRAEEHERKAADAETRLQRAAKERWVSSAAQSMNFLDPSDAAAFVNLDDIDDEKDAERAVKRLADAKKHLVKGDEPRIPGRVLENGRPPAAKPTVGSATVDADRQWAEEVAPQLKRMISGWSSTTS